jgi:virulence factor lipase-like protein
MPTTLTEQNSFVRRIFVLLVAAALLMPALALAETHPLFNLQSTTQSPFPSDRFTAFDAQQLTGLRVNMPLPNCASRPSDCADLTLLNQLDGFNLQPRLSIAFDGAIDPSTVNSNTVFLVTVPGPGLLGLDFDNFTPQVIGINQIVWDPASLTLFAESNDHLNEDSNYLLVVTTGVHDASGNPIAVSSDFAQFVHGDGGVDGKNADELLKRYQQALKHAVNAELPQLGLSRDGVAAASVFTTESATATLRSIRDQIKNAAPPAVNFNLGSAGEKTVFPFNTVTSITFNEQLSSTHPTDLTPNGLAGPFAALGVVPGAIGTVAFGKFSGKHWQNGNVFIPQVPTTQSVPSQGTEDLFFNLFIPAGPRPSNGWPVAIFGHGFGDNKQGAPFAVASILAHNGIASIAINVVGHGFGPNSTLTVNQGTSSVTFPEGGRSFDQDGNGKIDGTEGSSTFFLSPQGTIGSRDALQQTVADLMQLVRAIQGGIDADGDGLQDLDPARIYYAGQSFGGIYGTIFLGIEPDVRAGVPNVPGGTIIDIVRLSPTFQLLLTQALAVRVPSLLNSPISPFYNDNSPLRNLPPVTNNVPGAVAIQTVEDTSRWLGQAGDPVAWAPFIRKNPLPGDLAKSVIVQFARGDKTVPNPTATALIRSGDLKDRATFFRNDIAFALNPQSATNPAGFPKNPHTFLTNLAFDPTKPTLIFPVAVAIGAQTQIGVFFSTDGALTIDPDGSGPLFEVPIAGPLPEDLGFIP